MERSKLNCHAKTKFLAALKSHDVIDVYVYKVENNLRVLTSLWHVSRIHQTYHGTRNSEVFDGTVEIMSVSREAGDRTKVAVRSHNPNVDAIGTIVGRGSTYSYQPFPPTRLMLRQELKFRGKY